jgi:Domain of unknown function (4846)
MKLKIVLMLLPLSVGALHSSELPKFPEARTIAGIAMPVGFKRLPLPDGSFGEWLRNIRLKADDRVHLFDGSLKRDQSDHVAVLSLPLPSNNLQQCADAVMRMRTSYWQQSDLKAALCFTDNAGHGFWGDKHWDSLKTERYLQQVFAACGTLSLDRQLHPLAAVELPVPGDVLIHGGSPGHAMLIVDEAVDQGGKHIYLLAQGFMPAQDTHIVKNPNNDFLSPWFSLDEKQIITPGWVFSKKEIKKW